MKHVGVILQWEKVYSLEFLTTIVRRRLRICFWEGKELVTMTIAHCGRDVPAVRSCVLLCSQVLRALSLEHTSICCAGGSADFSKALIKALGQKAGIQYPFSLLPLQIEKLMHKPSFSVMGKDRRILDGSDAVGEIVWLVRREVDTVDTVFLQGEIVVLKFSGQDR